ncbi:rhomboid family intramembrane serine protease [Halorientalis pallida]|uniref:Rhomboid family intramembrane serine protease n=1 Tax=Halorientalis pallida TaxID=2479928 RepID=A0A498KW64_9EURY|nr:rhomboid family intramembrane serine protease [Halorientalis pallida]RXK49055.1 rhomboid family intramembrane serine protease [Halorientalis pallida]
MGAASVDRYRTALRDLGLIGTVAAVLVWIHLALPPAVRTRMAFRHESLDPVSLYTSAFVHLDVAHLAGNVAGFVAAALVAYGLCVQVGHRRWFRVTFAGFLLVLPVAVSLTSYAVIGLLYPGIEPVSRGFSGVGAAFAGFVFVALLSALNRLYDYRVAGYSGLAIWLLLLFEVYLIYVGDVTPVVGGLFAVGWVACLVGIGRESTGPATVTRRRSRLELIQLAQALLVVALLVSFVSVLFPPDIVEGGAVTNVFAHAAGFLYGVGGAALTARLVRQ